MGFGFDEDDLEDSVFGFGESDDTPSKAEEPQGYAGMSTAVDMDDDAKRKKKKISVILLLVMFVLALVASALIGVQRKKEDTAGKQPVKQEQTQTEQTQTEQSNSSGGNVLVVDNGWTQIDYIDIELSQQIKGTFTITDKQYFAKKTGDSVTKLELTVRATGEISGLTGSYTLDIPWRVAELLKLGDIIDVYYYIGDINGSRVVLDVSYTK